jgi:hypothetical protein
LVPASDRRWRECWTCTWRVSPHSRSASLRGSDVRWLHECVSREDILYRVYSYILCMFVSPFIPRLLLADYKAVFGATPNHLIGGLLVRLVMTSLERLAIIGSYKTCMHTCMHVAFGWVGGVVASTRRFVVINKAKRCGVNKSLCCASWRVGGSRLACCQWPVCRMAFWGLL